MPEATENNDNAPVPVKAPVDATTQRALLEVEAERILTELERVNEELRKAVNPPPPPADPNQAN